MTAIEIITNVYAEDLFTDTTGADVAASAERYADLLDSALSAAYPGARIAIAVKAGSGRNDTRVYVNGNESENDARHVDALGERVFTQDEWLVEA